MASPLPVVGPAKAGVSAPRLERLHRFLQRAVDEGDYLGAVALIVHQGSIVDWQAYGHRDLARSAPMAPDAIFRIHSMTKTITSVAVLMLMEEGELGLEDPIDKYLPGFSRMQVFAGGSADQPQLRPASGAITIRQLLTHTAGFVGGEREAPELVALFERADLHGSADLAEFSQRLGRLPLGADPGTQFSYDGASLEVLARLVEVLSGKPFEAFLQERIFAPLAMNDTGFSVPAGKRGRIADMTTTDRDGHLVLAATANARDPGIMMNPYHSGSGGLYSTAPDYARFCRMLLNGGELDGASILGRKTVELMMSNHLTQLDPPVNQYSDAEGFGLGGYVVLDVAGRGRPGSPGQFGWAGAGSTYFTIDRQEQLIAILMMQHLPQGLPNDPPRISTRFYNLVYQSLQ